MSVPDDDTFADTLIRDALIATHDAKQRGLSTRRFDNDLRKAVILRADVEQRLVGAVGRGEIVVHYQPIVDLNTGATSGFEALARWQRDGQLVQPSQWISVAESSDLIHDIGTEILIAAARQTERWRAGGADLAINVNVSARQLADPRLATALLTAITHVPKSRLVIEITESLAIDDIAHCTLASLRRLGVRTSLDDFGTGYSALAAIARLPIDQIKIGQEITDRVTQPDGNALVHATVSIANTFDLSVVAEGVESRPQHDALIAAGCHLAQGYLYGKPMSAHDATKWLALHPADAQSEHQAAHQLGCA
ncbi:MAG: EAL domain-containing protein [Frankiales bacterium]|nr:EAL domain-containing protein [Frankiales bacterium]